MSTETKASKHKSRTGGVRTISEQETMRGGRRYPIPSKMSGAREPMRRRHTVINRRSGEGRAQGRAGSRGTTIGNIDA